MFHLTTYYYDYLASNKADLVLATQKQQDGKEGVQYGALTIPLIKAIQEQQKAFQEQQKLIEKLEARIIEIESSKQKWWILISLLTLLNYGKDIIICFISFFL